MQTSTKTKNKPGTIGEFFLTERKESFTQLLDGILNEIKQNSLIGLNPTEFQKTILKRINSLVQSEREVFLSYIITCLGSNQLPHDIIQMIQTKAQNQNNIAHLENHLYNKKFV